MGQLKRIYLAALITLLITSCKKDFLETPPSLSVVRQQYISNLKTSQEFLNGIYADLAQYLYKGLNVMYSDLVTDNLKPFPGRQNYIYHYNWQQVVSETGEQDAPNSQLNMNSLWIIGYKIARNASYLLEKVNDFRQENPKIADSLLAQAYALRGLAHLELTKVFAQPYNFTKDGSHFGIPFISSSNYSAVVKQITVNEMYKYIIEDFNKAMEYSPEKQSGGKLVISQRALMALLAQLYLYKQDYINAKNLSLSVLNKVPILSSANFPQNLFKGKVEESEELFSLPPQEVPFFTFYVGTYFNSQGLLRFVATSDLANLINENPEDKRKAWFALTGANWLINKFPSSVIPTATTPPASYFHSIIRSSELCLIAAESYAQLNKSDSGRYYLDAIRLRANPSGGTSNATGSALIDSIYKERRKELCFEGVRLQDILRQKKGIHRVDAPPAYKNLEFPCNKAIAPLPYFEISMTGLKQNEDY